MTLHYTDPQGQHQPVNFRVYYKAEGKTQNDYFLGMLTKGLAWKLEPRRVTGDRGYSCVKNLKTTKIRVLAFCSRWKATFWFR
ncbi:hypothetical protein LZ558_11920 [Methylobacter sp. YRD-M1]|nr:hypothetical protein [Methylobacter sp. YRD-M1]WAK00557.1 hypothetical protein LZ558_11920 [Methylobacter sp. YRD-M1]